MKQKSFFVGVDSGGTKLEVLITDEHKKVIHEGIYPSCHYSVHGAEKTSTELSNVILNVIKTKKLKLTDCLGMAFGIAGARQEFDRAKLQKLFVKKIGVKNITVVTDAMNAITGAFSGDDGIILIAGTGSVLYGKHNDKLIRVGGWGRILGDQGSGFIIGREGLRELVKEYDHKPLTKKESVFSKLVRKEFGMKQENIVDMVFAQKFEIQRACECVIKAAHKNDKPYKKIVVDAADDLLQQIGLYIKLSKIRTKINIAFIGSLIENKNILSDTLKKGIKRNFKNVNIVKKKSKPTMGAIHIAMKGSK